MKNLIIVTSISLLLLACGGNKTKSTVTEKEDEIKAFCLDVNWRIASDKNKENIRYSIQVFGS